jgi:hypothetical protein
LDIDVRNRFEIGVAPVFVVFVEFARRCRGSRVYNQAIVEVSRDTVGLQLHIPFLKFEFCNLIVALSLNAWVLAVSDRVRQRRLSWRFHHPLQPLFVISEHRW